MCIFGALEITGGAVSVLELPFGWHNAHTLYWQIMSSGPAWSLVLHKYNHKKYLEILSSSQCYLMCAFKKPCETQFQLASPPRQVSSYVVPLCLIE